MVFGPTTRDIGSSSNNNNNSSNSGTSRGGSESGARNSRNSSTAPTRVSFSSSNLAFPLTKPAPSTTMNHLLQVARRTGKSAVGFKIQLVIHRMNAHLSNFNGAELVAVMTRHKKKAVTKSAPYQTGVKEVVWGDILPFSCTLYMAKTGLFQSKLFQIHIYDTRNDQNVATFEFDLAELVQSDKDSGKETITVATSKCQDPRASLSLTVISSRVLHLGGRKGSGHGDHEGSEISFDGSRSELSVCTLESRTSGTSSHHHQQSKQSPGMSRRTPESAAKANGLRGAFPAVHEDEVDGQDAEGGGGGSTSDARGQSSKIQELVHTIEDLENQLRQSESANVQLEKAGDIKDLKIQQLQFENEELSESVKQLTRDLQVATATTSLAKQRRTDSEDGDGVMQVDFMQYMSLKEEHDKLAQQLEALQSSKSALHASATKSGSAVDADDDADDSKSNSDASSANEYQDAQEPHLLAEISELKHSVTALRADNAQLLAQVSYLELQARELTAEVEKKDEALALAKAAAALAPPPVPATSDIDGESENDEHEEQMSEVKSENEKLMRQLSQLDGVVTQLKGEKSSLLGKLEHAESANERARRDIEGAQETIAQLAGEKERLAGQLQSAEDAHARATHELESAEMTISQLREQVQEISVQLEATQHDLHTLRHEELAASVAATAAAVVKTQDIQERWDELRQQNEQLQARVGELEKQLAEIEASGEAKEAELQQQVRDLQQETTSLREELEHLCANKQQAEDELLERTTELKDVFERQRALTIGHEQELTQLGMNNEELRAHVGLKTEEAQVLSAEWRQKVDTLEQENDYFQRELIDSKMKLAELTQQNDELSAQNKKMEKSIVEMKIQAAEKELKAKDGKKK